MSKIDLSKAQLPKQLPSQTNSGFNQESEIEHNKELAQEARDKTNPSVWGIPKNIDKLGQQIALIRRQIEDGLALF